MNNGQLHDDPLFRAVHDRLGDYEAPYDGADWDAMNRSLDQLPRTNRFKFRFNLNTLLALAGVAGAVALASYFIVNTKPEQQKPAVRIQPKVNPAPESTKETTTVAISTVASPPLQAETTSSAALLPVQLPRKQYRSQPTDTGNLRFGDQIDPLKGFVKNTQEKVDSLHTPTLPPPPIKNFLKKEIFPDPTRSAEQSNGSRTNDTLQSIDPKLH